MMKRSGSSPPPKSPSLASTPEGVDTLEVFDSRCPLEFGPVERGAEGLPLGTAGSRHSWRQEGRILESV